MTNDRFKILQKILKKNGKILNSRYRGERTFVVVPGINHTKHVDLSRIKGLPFTEERMFFFLFLLKYSNTKIVYVTSRGFNTELFKYYVGLVSDSEEDLEKNLKQLVHIEVNDARDDISLVQNVLESPKIITKIKKAITDPNKAVLRCYNATEMERRLAVKLGIPLFGSEQKFDFIGSKSGGRKVFKLAKTNVIPGFEDLKNISELVVSVAKLAKKHPSYKKMVVKCNYAASGKGNAILKISDFFEDLNIDRVKTPTETVIKLLKKNLKDYFSFQKEDDTAESYFNKFNRSGGIVELFIPGAVKYSPSTQVVINTNKKATITSTHEQVLGGPDGQLYMGCKFPAVPSHRKLIIKEGEKIASLLSKKGIIGNFAIDYVVVYDKNHKNPIVWPIEINLRKGGTTHPFRSAFFLTGARYNPNTGNLMCGKTQIHYVAMEIIQSEKYMKLKPMDLINLVEESKIGFNFNTKKGALIYSPGTLSELGKFSALCIGHSDEEAEKIYKKLIKLVNSKVK